jgi:uncharacterized protein
LRGIALIGIALVNAQAFAFNTAFYPRESYINEASEATVFLLLSLVSGKFFLLFSFLFGFSSQYILNKDQLETRRRFKRRLLALGVLGVCHGVFLFFGDILAVYACLGFVLLRWQLQTSNAVLKTAFAWLGIATVVGLMFAFSNPAQLQPTDTEFLKIFETIGNSAWPNTIGYRASMWISTWFVGIFLYSGSIALMFALGTLAARHDWLSAQALAHKYWQTIGKFLWIPALFACMFYAYETVQVGTDLALSLRYTSVIAVVHSLFAPLLTLAYITWAWQLRSRHENALAWLRPLGAMSLTTYLSQSALFAVFFSAWGLGYFNKLTAFEVFGVSIAVITINVLFAHFWMAKFKQGPLERLVTQFSKSGAS